jgi:hypothetical protein
MPSDPSGTPLSATALEEGSEQLPQYKSISRSNGASTSSAEASDIGNSTAHVVALAGGEEFEQPPESGKW